MAELSTIDEASLRRLVQVFYSRVRADPLIGPVFDDAVDDWPHHFALFGDFWTSVMLGAGLYKGRPVPAHRKHMARITPAMFERWLALWGETTSELMVPGAAAALQEKAARIAESLQLAMFFELPPAPGGKAA